MTFEDLASWLFSRTTGGVQWGLERTERLLAGVGDPHRSFRSILIGGTNGKGSVAALVDSALRAADSGTLGLYTSPHLIAFNERIRVDGSPLSDEVLLAAALRLRPRIEASGASFFEATTAIAFLAFAEAGVDVAVVEVGLGGRLDATNVLTPVATAITNVRRDHVGELGDSPAQIAAEKAGIFKKGVPALVAEESRDLREVFDRSAAAAGAPLVYLDDVASVSGVQADPQGTSFMLRSALWGERTVRVPLRGTHQARNAATAIELLGMLPESMRPEWASVDRGMVSARWPGRLQLERIRGTTWLFDVAHNADGARALAASLVEFALPEPRVMVIGILADKDWAEMLAPLVEGAGSVILTVPDSAPLGRRWDPSAAAGWLSDRGVGARVVPSLSDALARATTLAPHGTIVVTGSIHTVGDAMKTLGIAAA